MNPYSGHDHQVYGIEEYRLVGGKGAECDCFRCGTAEE